MAACVGQASFKNSRIFPRPTTLTALTNAIVVPALGSVIIPANVNRTYLTIRNGSLAVPPADELFYSYPASPGSFLLLPREAVDVDSPQAVTVSNPNAVPVTLYTDEGSG
jgi:hypothetical protein